jgi:hypothetical protein
MRHLSLSVLCTTLLLTSSQCDNEVVPTDGHLKLTVSYPELVVENDTFYFIQVPGVGAEARLYDKDAKCDGYRDAKIDVAWIGNDATYAKYTQVINEIGEALFNDIPADEYYLVIFTGQWYRYTEKYIKVNGGDTLNLTKDFTADLTFDKSLEPWDYVIPPTEK